MDDTAAEKATGWGSSRSTPRPRIRHRDVIPALVAILALTFAHVLFGASQPMASLALSFCMIASALAAVFAAGPRHITFGMMIGASAIWAFGITGAAGNLSRAAPGLAVLFAAGAMWTIGYISARKRGVLDVLWAGVVWSSFTYCAWMFFNQMGGVLSGQDVNAITADFQSPAAASLLFGAFTLIGASRVLHVVKQMDSEALARSEMIDRLMRDALGGMLLMVFAITCLGLSGSRVGILLTTAVLLGHIWWDTHAITSRSHRGALIRVGSRFAPLVAMVFAALGVWLAWFHDETVLPGVGLSETAPHMQRLQTYLAAWLEKPVFGHGLGSIDVIGDRAMTLANAKAMLPPGGVQNVFVHWLVETGVAGLVAILLFIGATHLRVFASLSQRKTPRTFMRLAIAVGMLLLLHGVSDSSLDVPSLVWLYALLLGAACGVVTARSSSQQAGS